MLADLKESLKNQKALSRTFTGELIDLLDPHPDQIHIEDIAHHLSMICRFAGSVRRFYSVAEHCLNVYELCKGHSCELEALLHDASEAYLSDLNGNLKHADELAGYRAVEKNFEYIIAAKFGLRQGIKAVKTADYIMLEVEGTDLVNGWNGGKALGETLGPQYSAYKVAGMSPTDAESLYLYTFKKLKK